MTTSIYNNRVAGFKPIDYVYVYDYIIWQLSFICAVTTSNFATDT
jgi:hypothetical protein